MAGETALTVESLKKSGLAVADTGFTGANPDVANDNIFVNTGKTFISVHADGHDDTVVATISPDAASVESDGLGALTVSDAVLTLAASHTTPQNGFIQVPAGFNTAGKCVIVWTSGGGAWIAGEVKVAVLRIDN